MPFAPDLRALISDLFDVAKTFHGRLAGFLERHTSPDVFVCQQIDMKAQLVIYFAPRLLWV